MNWVEEAIRHCMDATAELYDASSNDFHRAILRVWWRHVHLEGAGKFDEIVGEDMMVEHPVYRVAWGETPAVIEGKDGVLAFYNSVGESLLWNSDDLIAVNDWGVADELTFHQVARGEDLSAAGYDVEKPDAYYHVSSRQAFVWPFDDRARLIGEHLYEDKTSLRIEEVDGSDLITPARSREIHAELLGELEKRFGPDYWVFQG